MTKYIIKLTALMAIILGIEEILILTVLPSFSFTLLPAIPIFFAIFGAIVFTLIFKNKNISVSAVMGAKMLKILLSLVIILAYIFLIKENSKAFLAAYFIAFLAYLLFETWVLSSINKKKE